MKESKIRLRFAPSPTGYLHLGGARTALFNYLFARHHGGLFILRVEDTDRERSTKESIDAIFEGLKWLDLDWDEGPFFQSERLDLYRSVSDRLLSAGHAYRCYCTPDELEERRKAALEKGLPPKYDGRCRSRSTEGSGPHVIRFRHPETSEIVVRDLIRGDLRFDGSLFDDWILVRSDGYPTYNFAVVVDDIDMRITHVLRGDDHINNTPRQIALFETLGESLPFFAHIPMIHGADRTKLSKRHGATSVMSYRDMGFLPQALVNYIARLGWSHKDQEIFTRRELVDYFDLDHVGSSPAVFNPEKLLWLNAQYMKNADPNELAEWVRPLLHPVMNPVRSEGNETQGFDLTKIVDEWKTRSRTLLELADSVHPFIDRDFSYAQDVLEKHLNQANRPLLSLYRERFAAIRTWDRDHLTDVLKTIGTERNLKLGQLAQPLRAALTGQNVSPGIYEVLILLGRQEVIDRLDRALRTIPPET